MEKLRNLYGSVTKTKEEIPLPKRGELVGEPEEDENPERGNWSGKLDFLLSCLGYAVGLGNVWRFPYLCFKHGGGAFLIPYFLMLAIIGIPCFLMELHLGQYTALGPVVVYEHLAPIFKGLGFANFFSQTMVGLYYNMIIAWTIYYLFASFTSHLPWQDCTNSFNDEFCFSITDFKACEKNRTETNNTDLIYINRTCTDDEEVLNSIWNNLEHWYSSNTTETLKNGTEIKLPCVYTNATFCNITATINSITELFDVPVNKRQSSSGQYLKMSVLQEGPGIEPDEMGQPLWGLVLSLLAAWLIIFLCLFKGIKSSGKVVYVTAIFPYVVLIILLIRAVTLPGASKGIHFYLVPDMEKLNDIKVWEGAAVQIFFSLSVAGGGLVTLASYNKFHNNIVRDTIIVCISNCMTSFTAGFAIFSVLGFMANELGLEVKDVASEGTGLAFEAYPDLVTRLPGATFWSILFFLMLFTLGLDSQFAITETILTGILDWMPKLRPWKTYVVFGICALGFILGLPLTCPGGGYVLDLLDYYAASWPYLFIGLCELVIISYFYGFNTYLEDIIEMSGVTSFKFAKYPLAFFYCFLSPLVILVILIISWVNYEPLTKQDYEYPGWANGVGWFIAMLSILAVPFYAVQYVVATWYYGDRSCQPQDLWNIIKSGLSQTPEWRANAIRASVRDGAEARYEYKITEDGKQAIRHRKWPGTQDPTYDNKGMS